jgi:hypothetical protein
MKTFYSSFGSPHRKRMVKDLSGCVNRRKGSVLAMFAAGLVTFVGMLALTIDLGMVYWNETVYTRGVNSIALSAALAKCSDDTSNTHAKDVAEAMAQANGLTGYNRNDCKINPFGNNPQLIQVTPTIQSRTFFAGIFGFDSFNITCSAYAIGAGSGAYIVSDEAAISEEGTPSGYFPMMLFHGDLRGIVQKGHISNGNKNSGASEAALAALICTSGQQFSFGDKVWLKGGKRLMQSICYHINSGNDGRKFFGDRSDVLHGQNGTTLFAGSVDLPYGGIPDVGARFQRFMDFLSVHKPGEPGIDCLDMIDDDNGWTGYSNQGPPNGTWDRRANTRAAEDASTVENHKAFSARLVIVPICRAHVSSPEATLGSGVPYLASLPYIYRTDLNPAMKLLIIGYAKVWIDGYGNFNTGAPGSGSSKGVVEATFVDYVGTPPNGQEAG